MKELNKEVEAFLLMLHVDSMVDVCVSLVFDTYLFHSKLEGRTFNS